MEARNVAAERPADMRPFRVTEALRLTVGLDDATNTQQVVLVPGTVIHYSHRGPRQVFVEGWGRSWSISHHFVLPDDRLGKYRESWSSEDSPDGLDDAVCDAPFPPTGMEHLADDPSTPDHSRLHDMPPVGGC
jgi:hypothetical protein